MVGQFDIQRIDSAEMKRVELQVHTKMSRQDSVADVKDLIQTAVDWGWDAIAITDHASIQAFPEAMDYVAKHNLNIKVIYGMEGYLTDTDSTVINDHHVIILAKNLVGLHNLYRLVSLSYQHYFRRPRIPKNLLQEHREGLILGTPCTSGELIKAMVAGYDEKTLSEIASFYDFIAMQPIPSYDFVMGNKRESKRHRYNFFKAINRKIIELTNRLGKIPVATSDVHFLHPNDAICRAAFMYGKGTLIGKQPPLFLHTTQEMLEAFEYLGEELAYEIVVANPRSISQMVERIAPAFDRLRYVTLSHDVDESDIEQLKHTFGTDNVFRMGLVQKVSKVTADAITESYINENQISLDEKLKQYIAKGICGIKRATGINPHDVVIIPSNDDVNCLTPIQISEIGNVAVTHFDCRKLGTRMEAENNTKEQCE